MDADPAHILAIDLGTSGPKVALVTMQGRIVAFESEATDLIMLPQGGVEQNPQQWWRAICRASQRLFKRHREAAADVAAVCCTGQWSGTVAVDGQGRSLANAIIWMDTRGAPAIRATFGGPVRIAGYGIDKLLHWLRITGGIPGRAGKDAIAHILYIKQCHPELYHATHCFLEPKDYINLKLTGIQAATLDSIAVHWLTDNRDLRRVDYHERLLRMSGLTRDKLPDLRPAVDILGPVTPSAARQLGLDGNPPVVAGTPDLHSAAIGSGAVADYQAHLYVGTSSWLTCHVPFKKTDLIHNMASLPAAVPQRYFVANEQEAAGACLTFVKQILFDEHQQISADAYFEKLDQWATQASAGCGRVIFTPWLYGERTPVENHAIRAGFHNMSLSFKRPQLVRSVFEGVALNTRWLLQAVEKFVRRPLDPIRIIGGGANSRLWCQIFADVTGRTIQQVDQPVQANARGAAFLAAAALGQVRFDQINARVAVSEQFAPRADHRAIYDRLFAEFKALYRKTKGICARLNG